MFDLTNELFIKLLKLKCVNFHNVSIRIKEDNLDNKFKKPTNKINKHQFYKLIQEEIGL